RSLAFTERHAVGGIGDGKDRGVAPEAASREEGGALAAQPVEVVDELQQPLASRTLQAVGQRVVRAAIDAGQALDEGTHVRRPKRASTAVSISSIRWRTVCSARAR